ncbi:hypothetical protein ANCCAN_30317 [Ancylostoma caninum]|uniref:Uncharacterized protein n=1 Tax=Ancylostoma caninum TaxID=29170 RepID=A0A368EWB8_ANCCA|nr:hypothetical protein ANCCAN_30317 [Ancylostoma caninum]
MKKGAASIYETAKGGLANLTDRFSKWLKKRSNDSKEAAGESTTPVANVRRKKSVGDDDVGDEHHEITLDFKRINDDDGEQQSKVRLAREARMIGFPSSPQLQTKGATSPKIPARPTPTQVTFDRPSVKLHGNDSPSVKLPEEVSSLPTNEDGDSGTGDMASEKTHPKTDYYRRRDPLTKKEYSVDKPIARDESGRPYRNRKHPRRKSHRKLSRRKFHRKEDPSTDTEEDDLEGGPLWGRNEFIIAIAILPIDFSPKIFFMRRLPPHYCLFSVE